MKVYTLKLTTDRAYHYALYDGETRVSDEDLITMFSAAGEMYFTLDFNSYTPSSDSVQIVNSNNKSIISHWGSVIKSRADINYYASWAASTVTPGSGKTFSAYDLVPKHIPDNLQWSDLAEKIKRAISGGAKELTSDMVNYPDNNPTDIALWKLEPGFYYRTGGQTPTIRSSTNKQVSNCIGVLVCKAIGNTYMYCLPGYDTTQIECFETATSSGTAKTVYDGNSVGTLAYTYMLKPATGSGAPTTATYAKIGDVYIDTDTDTAYMCTKASGGEYTWKQITA